MGSTIKKEPLPIGGGSSILLQLSALNFSAEPLVLIAFSVGLVTAEVGSGKCNFCSAVDRIEGDYRHGLNGGGSTFSDEGGAGL